jgi:hypothetical protein
MSLASIIGGVASSGGVQNYVKGYPFDGPVEANVAAQWVFDEASGNITDEVSGLVLTAAGSATYSVAGGAGLYADITPGITCGNGIYFDNPSDTSLAIGTSDFVLEVWFKASSLVNSCPFFSTGDNTGDEDGFAV